MASVTSGSNATVFLNPGDTITIEPQDRATARLENPVGTLVAQFNDKRTFGPFKTARSVKVVSVTGAVFYEVSTAKALGSMTLNADLDLSVSWGSGAPTASAGKGSLYIRLDGSTTSTRVYVNTDGATTWTSLTTAA